jgi:hypothetical protein
LKEEKRWISGEKQEIIYKKNTVFAEIFRLLQMIISG